jgi:hypothetical protein
MRRAARAGNGDRARERRVWCWHRSQLSHSHGVARCRSPSMVVAPGVFMGTIRRPPQHAELSRYPLSSATSQTVQAANGGERVNLTSSD